MKCQKHLFDMKEGVHYLNCATKAPLLKASEQACIDALHRERDPSGLKIDDFFDHAEEGRQLCGKLLKTDPDNLAVVPSVSYGYASMLRNVKGKENGKAITLENEFPSGYYSLKTWCQDHNNELKIVSPGTGSRIGRTWHEKLLSEIDETTSVVLMCAVHWMTGTKFDLEAIGEKCSSVGAVLLVDATQAMGAMDIDVEKCKITGLVAATYKWSFGPHSVGMAYFSEYFHNGVPLEESWMNRTNCKEFSNLTAYQRQYKAKAGRFNVGESSHLILMPMANAGMQQILEWGCDNIQDYCKELVKPLMEYLTEQGVTLEEEKYVAHHIHGVKTPPGMDKDLLLKNLEEDKVLISVRGENLRVSVNIFNDEEDIARLLQCMKRTMAASPQNGVSIQENGVSMKQNGLTNGHNGVSSKPNGVH